MSRRKLFSVSRFTSSKPIKKGKLSIPNIGSPRSGYFHVTECSIGRERVLINSTPTDLREPTIHSNRPVSVYGCEKLDLVLPSSQPGLAFYLLDHYTNDLPIRFDDRDWLITAITNNFNLSFDTHVEAVLHEDMER